MITEIPTEADFHAAGANQLYLAWQISIHAIQEYEELDDLDLEKEERAAAAADYWTKCQPALANAFGLIQQAMEMALKGRIAAVSPFLLIGRDPKDWPKGVDSRDVTFSEFRTLDAADLVKVHNTFAGTPLDDEFRFFWDGVRRDRNKIMHSINPYPFDPPLLIRSILAAADVLFADPPWPERLLSLQEEGKYAAYGLTDDTQNVVMGQIDVALRHLAPAERRRFFGFDFDRRSYVCPSCHDRANRDWQTEFPALAQFPTKIEGATILQCTVCNEDVEVERAPCTNSACMADVIHEGLCLTCLRRQDSPHDFDSGLRQAEEDISRCYEFDFRMSGMSTRDSGFFADDASAMEHARRGLMAAHLQVWTTVIVGKRIFGPPSWNSDYCVLGSWHREERGPTWLAGSDRESETGARSA